LALNCRLTLGGFFLALGVVAIVVTTDTRLQNFVGDIFEFAQILGVVLPGDGPVPQITVNGTKIEIALGSSA